MDWPRRYAWVVWMFVAGTNSTYALDARKALTQYSRTVWTQQQGLPQDTIRAIAQTANGYLWLGTDEGLARFDGYEFVVFNRDHDNLPSNSITALAASRDGSLWIGHQTVWRSTGMAALQLYAERRPSRQLDWSLFVDHADACGSWQGGNLSHFDGARFTNYQPGEGYPQRAFERLRRPPARHARRGRQQRGGKTGKWEILERVRTFGADERLSRPGMQVDHNGNLWILGVRGLIQGLPDGTIRRYGARDGLSDSFGLHAIWEDHDRNLWVGTDNGVARLEGGRFETWNGSQGGPRDSVLCIFEDREGNIWMGSNNGLTRFREDAFTVYGKGRRTTQR
jgi:ligand-binding sensor domain-containing protein